MLRFFRRLMVLLLNWSRRLVTLRLNRGPFLPLGRPAGRPRRILARLRAHRGRRLLFKRLRGSFALGILRP
jgi:hypothetical protein